MPEVSRVRVTVLEVGPRGPQGPASVDLGTFAVLDPDQQPTVTNAGTAEDLVLDFSLPRAPDVSVGTVTTGSPGGPATVSDVGTGGDVVLDFGLPRGEQGLTWQGDWDVATGYQAQDAVRHRRTGQDRESSYVALQASTGVEPPAPANAPTAEWDLIAEGGEDGGGAETLGALSDVDTAGVVDGQALVYDAATSAWVPSADLGGRVSKLEFKLGLVNIGDPFFGGFFAGIIDTDANSADIDANDTRQAGKRYALIVSPKAIGEPSSNLRWRTSRTGVAEARTRWDGLHVTDHIIGGNAGSLSDFPIFEFCDQVRTSDPVPDDGGSDWYVPALDELELLYRHFKPGTEDNFTGQRSLDFPDPWDNGYNPSSDPQGAAYTESDPEQTTVTAFQGGGAETLQFDADGDNNRLWSATEASGERAWLQNFRGSLAGIQFDFRKDSTNRRCRLVRRVEL